MPGLAPGEARQVREANSLAKLAAQIAQEAVQRGDFFLVENPARSHLWSLAPYRDLEAMDGVQRWTSTHRYGNTSVVDSFVHTFPLEGVWIIGKGNSFLFI